MVTFEVRGNEKAREHAKYKKFQKRYEHYLETAEDQHKLNEMTICQLLTAYTKVEEMYTMRSLFRNKYFNKGTGDFGHQQFISYLIKILGVYEQKLKEKFENQSLSQEHQPEEVEEEPEQEDVTCSTLNKTIRQIQKKQKKRKEEEIWRTEIPGLIKIRQNIYNKSRTFFYILKSMFTKYRPQITDVETIDILQYYFNVIDITSVEHLIDQNTSLVIEKNLDKKDSLWGIDEYPLTVDEYIGDFVSDEFLFDHHLRVFHAYTSSDLFSEVIRTVLNVTLINRQYVIYRINYGGEILFFPDLEFKPFIDLKTKEKCILSINIETSHLRISKVKTDICQIKYKFKKCKPYKKCKCCGMYKTVQRYKVLKTIRNDMKEKVIDK